MIGRGRLLEIVSAMPGKRVVVYGDIVADRFIYGTPKRISREAPVLILRQYREDMLLGGAGNATANVLSLGGIPFPVAMIGTDDAGDRLVNAIRSRGVDVSGILRIDRYGTPTKTRVVGGMQHATRQQIVRFDVEDSLVMDEPEREKIGELLREQCEKSDATLVSDYGYGTVNPAIVGMLGPHASGPVLLDSRYGLLTYRGVTAATPNEEEAAIATGLPLGESDDESETLTVAARMIRERIDSDALLITRGSRGMALLRRDHDQLELIPVHGTDQVADVTGAGDTVIAAFTLALAAGASFSEAARVANYAASVVVMKMSTATVTNDELRHTVERDEALS